MSQEDPKKKSKGMLNEDAKNKIKVLSLLLVGCIICLMVLSGLEDENQTQANSQPPTTQEVYEEAQIDTVENNLKEILTQINGAGAVDVMVTYENSEEIQPAYNTNTTTETTNEKDSEGGERTVTTSSENNTMITSGSNEPIILKTNEAVVKGVIVVAEGADVAEVKQTLYSAVQTALQIQGHQVEIYDK